MTNAEKEKILIYTFESNRKKHINYVRKRLGDIAEDVVQDAYLKAWRFLDKFILPECPKDTPLAYWKVQKINAWLDRILWTTMINRYKHLNIKKCNQYKTYSIHEEYCKSDSMDESNIIEWGLSDEIIDILDSMLPQFERVITLIDLAGLSYQETADLLGIPKGTVMSRLHRARKYFANKYTLKNVL